MAKGRKIATNTNSDWENVFYNSVGTYVQCINNELSKEIKSEPLSNHIKIVGGYAFKTVQYQKEGIPIIRISDFSNEQVILKDVIYYKEAKELERYELNEGDIIIALTGGTIAKLAIVQAGLGKIYLNQRVGKFQVLHPELFEKEYIYWIARSVQSIIKNLAWGAAIPNVSPKQIENIEFPLPTIEIQQGIIKFLNDLKSNSLSDKEYFNADIEKKIVELQYNQFSGKDISLELTHQLDLIKQMRQAFLREAMQGKLVKSTNTRETGHQLLAKIKAEKAQLIAEKKLKKEKELPPITEDEIPFEIPEHWAWCRLGEICTKIGSGSTPKGSNYSEIGKPFFRSQNIYDNGLVYDDIKFVSDEVQKHMNGTIVLANDILLNITGGSMGRCALVPNNLEEGNVSQHVCIIRPLSLDNIFLHKLILSPYFQKLIFSSTTGAGREGLPKYNLEQFIIPLPPLHEQEQIVAKLEEFMAFCDGLEQSIKESQGYSEMLLQQVLREALQGEEVSNKLEESYDGK
jgi:type I restriction enzyme S subunit